MKRAFFLHTLAAALSVATLSPAFAQSTTPPWLAVNDGTEGSASALNVQSLAIGPWAQAGDGDTSVDEYGAPNSSGQTALGYGALAFHSGATATGAWSNAEGFGTTATGIAAQATADGATATGGGAGANGLYATATGTTARANGDYTVATGNNAQAQNAYATAVGAGSYVTGEWGSAFGMGASAQALNCLALGADTTCDQAWTTAFGNRRLVQLAAGVDDTDGVNIAQLRSAMGAFGGGADMAGGALTLPTYVLASPGAAGSYNNVGDALSALDDGLVAVNTRIDNLPAAGAGTPGAQGPKGDKGDTGPQGPAGKDGVGGADPLAVRYDDDSKATVTLGEKAETTTSPQGDTVTPLDAVASAPVRVRNLAEGMDAHDAVNVEQVNAQVQEALRTAKTYADAGDQQTLQQAKAYTDWRMSRLDDRFSRTQALATAQTQMVATFAGADPSHRNRMAAGVGMAGGHNALSVGYQHVSEGGHVAWNLGGAIAGSERTVGAGIGYSW